MAFPEDKGQKNKVHNTGEIVFGTDGTNFFPALGSTAGVASGAGQGVRLIIAQREPFIFRPGASALGSGAVSTGTRTGAGTVTTVASSATTVWGSWTNYQPLRRGQIDGASSGGIISGQITIGIKTGAATADAKVTAQIANTANTGSPTTFLALSGTAIGCTTAEIYRSYDLPYLITDTAFNAVPFSVRLGVQSNLSGTTIIGRIMESSYIMGEFEPGT